MGLEKASEGRVNPVARRGTLIHEGEKRKSKHEKGCWELVSATTSQRIKEEKKKTEPAKKLSAARPTKCGRRHRES